MNTKKIVVLGATVLGLGAAAAGAYKATHPSDARGPETPDPGKRRERPSDALLDAMAQEVQVAISGLGG